MGIYCPKCGKKIEDRAVFCPYCGVKQDSDIYKENAPVEDVTNIDEQIGPNPQHSNSGRAPLSNRAKKNVSQSVVKTSDTGQVRLAASSVRKANTAGSPLLDMLMVDKIIGAAAFVLMIVVMFVPLSIPDSLDYHKSYTLFTIYGGSDTVINTIFVTVYVLIALLFVVFKFIWKNKIPSTIGCILSWILLLFTFPFTTITIETQNAVMPGMQSTLTRYTYYPGVGFYLWAAACILQIVSLVLDHRKLRSRR